MEKRLYRRMRAMEQRDAKHVADLMDNSNSGLPGDPNADVSRYGGYSSGGKMQLTGTGGSGANHRTSKAVHGGNAYNFFKVGTGYAAATSSSATTENTLFNKQGLGLGSATGEALFTDLGPGGQSMAAGGNPSTGGKAWLSGNGAARSLRYTRGRFTVKAHAEK